MSNLIKVLDSFTANQIAAGEVVERPASVVKELVENSLDAGATKIEIAVNGAGVEQIRVTDNGSGMSREDAIVAFQRHATSKISSPSDLASIGTLGFRGEALPSIASVSCLEVLTREREMLSGTQIFLNGGKVSQIQDIGCPVGTTLMVRDLFFNTPARRKFLKSNATEMGQISDVIGRMAMAYPQVAFKYSNEGRVLLQTTGFGNLLEAVSQVYGKEQAREMIAVNTNEGELRLEGYLGRPHQARASRMQQTFFINGRFIRSKTLSLAISEGYHTLLPANRFPVLVLNVSLPLNAVDVNVHPTKLEVRFTHEREIITFISASVKKALNESNLIPRLRFTSHKSQEAEAVRPISQVNEPLNALAIDGVKESQLCWQDSLLAAAPTVNKPEPMIPGPLRGYTGRATLQDTLTSDELTSDELTPEKLAPDELAESTLTKQDINSARVQQRDVGGSGYHEVESIILPSPKFPDLLPLGQIDLTYIVASGPEGLYIIDQHAAHERINFEHLWDLAVQGKIESQLLIESLTLELTPQEMSVLVENITLLTDLGFLLEHFGGNTFLVRGYPINLPTGVELPTVIRDLLDLLSDGSKQIESRLLRKELIYSLACKSSIKANNVLNRAEMEHLLWRLSHTQNPFTCPHGRPTIIAITSSELAKRFQRT